MANAYCTIAQFQVYFDTRQMAMLSADDDSATLNTTLLQTMLDTRASELEMHLSGRYSLPLATVPLALTLWVARGTHADLYGRRSDRPKECDAEEQWCKNLIDGLDTGRLSLPGIDRASVASLVNSESLEGRSRFDGLREFDSRVSPTATGGQ